MPSRQPTCLLVNRHAFSSASQKPQVLLPASKSRIGSPQMAAPWACAPTINHDVTSGSSTVWTFCPACGGCAMRTRAPTPPPRPIARAPTPPLRPNRLSRYHLVGEICMFFVSVGSFSVSEFTGSGFQASDLRKREARLHAVGKPAQKLPKPWICSPRYFITTGDSRPARRVRWPRNEECEAGRPRWEP